ncbi:organomercurial lyase [Streptomyces sp. NPDC058611]|uniref:organomercurial lyase n=1 Tax=unclassified Streptomyces TaxID=2593676 RepID=UPI003656E81A
MSAMLGQDVLIRSSDPVDGQPVTVTFTGDEAEWEPAIAVVFVGRRAGDGPAVTVCCDSVNFFTSRASAELWHREHPDVRGQIVSQGRAIEIGRQAFGPLLKVD